MKAAPHFRFILVIALSVALVSCDGLFDDFSPEPEENTEILVTTNFPEISQANVVFKGEVNNVSSGERVEYGFMWYISSEDEPTIHRIELGSRSGSGQFQFVIDDLPKNEALVVCAFAIDSKPYKNEVVGEERDFDWSL